MSRDDLAAGAPLGSAEAEMAAEDGAAGPSPMLAGAARNGIVGLAGSVVAAAAGLALTIVVGRGLGTLGSGHFFVVVAVVTVLFTVAKVGADTGVIWALPRARALGRPDEVRRTLLVALVPAVVVSVVFALATLLGASLIADLVVDGADTSPVADLLRVAAPFLVVAAPMAVVLAGLRGLGTIAAFTVVQNIVVPGARPLLVAAALGAGLGVTGALVAWSVPFVLGLLLGVVLLVRRLEVVVGRRHRRVDGRETRAIAGEFWRFSSARSGSALLEVLLVWADVIIVAALTDARTAGIYAAASRFITTGTLAEAAMRVALAPRVSALLAVGRLREAAHLNATATQWIITLSWPLFIVLAVWSSTILALFGPGFEDGGTALTVLSVGMLVGMAAGNSQTVLLMSGRSAWQLGNKMGALALNITLNLLLVPQWGMVGAAVAWSATIVLDALVVVTEVRLLVGLRTPASIVVPVMAASAACFLVPGLATRLLVGGSWTPLAASLVVSCVLYAGALWLLRSQFDIDSLRAAVRPRRRESAVTADPDEGS